MKFQCEYVCSQLYGLTPVAAAHIVGIALRSDSEVRIEANGHCANAVSICGLLSLSIRNGDLVKVTVDGEDGYDVMRNIEAVITHHTQRGTRHEGDQRVPQLVPA